MALSPQLQQFKSSGVYRLEFDKSQTVNIPAETIRLVVGRSKKGPYNTPVLIEDVEQLTFPKEKDIELCINSILERNSIQHSDIDTLMLGMNGDIDHNIWYEHVSEKLLPNTNVVLLQNR